MSIKVGYIDQGRGVIICQSGVVKGEEIIAVHDEIYEQHSLDCQQYHIIDKSWCTEYDVTASEMEIMANQDCRMTDFNSDIIMAVIESNYLRFNMTAVWQAYIDGVVKYSKAFDNQVEALRWVKKSLQEIQNKAAIENRVLQCLRADNRV